MEQEQEPRKGMCVCLCKELSTQTRYDLKKVTGSLSPSFCQENIFPSRISCEGKDTEERTRTIMPFLVTFHKNPLT